MAAETIAAGRTSDDRQSRRVAFLLAGAQSLYGSYSTILITLSGLVGYYLAENKEFATLPISFIVLGTAITTVPAALSMRRFGRRAGFLVGALSGVLGASLAVTAIYLHSFALFCAAMLIAGIYQAYAQYYRFAAADTASPEFTPKAISWVMIGGVVAAIMGPLIAIWTRDLFLPLPFAGGYAANAGLAILAMGLLSFLSIPRLSAAEQADSGRPLLEIMRQPLFIVAVGSGMTAFSIMILVMTATPLAMVACGLLVDDAALVIQWHALAMFVPSFFTGHLIARFGVIRIILVGLALLAVCGIVALGGLEFARFWTALVFLGLGWNFAFIGATTLLTECYRPEERAKTQAANDLIVFVGVAGASFLSGNLLHSFGWNGVNLAVFPAVLLAVALIGWIAVQRRRALPAS